MPGLSGVTAGLPAHTDATTTQHDDGIAGWKVGATLAGVAGIASFSQSLLPRSSTQQVIVTAASMALAFGIGVGANAVADQVDEHTGLGAVGSRLAVAGAGALGVVGATLAMRGRPSIALDAVRTGAGVIGGGAVVGAALIGEQALVDRVQDHVPGGAVGAHAAIIGAAALATGALVFGHARSSAVSAETEAAYLKSVGGLQGNVKPAATFDPAHFDSLLAQRAKMTTVSGLLPGTRLPDGVLNSQGFKFVHEATPTAEIARVMGVPESSVVAPVRVYGGLEHAATHEELAQKIYDEAVELGAFSRKDVVLYVPSGTGHVNPMPVAATEYLAKGDVASIAMQYGDKPSVQSLNKVDDSTDLFRRVLAKFSDHIAAMPEGERPRLSTYGESLGGWGMQDTFLKDGPAGVAKAGVDNMISVGTPRWSKLRADAIGLGGHRLDATGTMFEFDNLKELQALPADQRAGVRSFLLSHYNDPVNKSSPLSLFQRPEWLASKDHAMGVPRKMKWMPVVTGVQGIVDTVNGANGAVPGVLGRTGHDYRADMAGVMDDVLGFGASKDQLAGINGGLEQLELGRVHGTFPTPFVAAAA
ncbi:MAG: putative rane protein [Thermoleophilia bacterium]|nr:putative rane protein [Thermoleophilia bacterium]